MLNPAPNVRLQVPFNLSCPQVAGRFRWVTTTIARCGTASWTFPVDALLGLALTICRCCFEFEHLRPALSPHSGSTPVPNGPRTSIATCSGTPISPPTTVGRTSEGGGACRSCGVTPCRCALLPSCPGSTATLDRTRQRCLSMQGQCRLSFSTRLQFESCTCRL